MSLTSPLAVGAQDASVRGTVIDSVRRGALEEATVIAMPVSPTRDSAFHSARTDGRGNFVLTALRPGHYELTVEHPFTDSLGISVLPREVEIPASGTVTVSLALPSPSTLRRRLCGATITDSTLGVMLGVVHRLDGTPISGATVVFSWTDLDFDRATAAARQTRLNASVPADSAGVYRACGLPLGVAILVQAQLGAQAQSGIIEDRIGNASVLVRDLVVDDSTPRALVVAGQAISPDTTFRGAGVVSGIVVSDRGNPIADAQVHLFGTPRSSTTNARGEFRLDGMPMGTQGFEVLALGYLPRRSRLEVGRNTADVRFVMRRVAVLLDSVQVTATRRFYGDKYREFEERLRGGLGQFVTESDIERRHPFCLTDVLRQMHGFQVAGGGGGGCSATLVGARGATTLRGLLPPAQVPATVQAPGGMIQNGRACPEVYLDGAPTSLSLDEIPPSLVHGIEVYTQGEAPAKYGASCGVILVWTK